MNVPRAIAALSAAALSLAAVPPAGAGRRTACAMPRSFLERTARGVFEGRSGDIQIVTRAAFPTPRLASLLCA